MHNGIGTVTETETRTIERNLWDDRHRGILERRYVSYKALEQLEFNFEKDNGI